MIQFVGELAKTQDVRREMKQKDDLREMRYFSIQGSLLNSRKQFKNFRKFLKLRRLTMAMPP